MNRRAPLRGPPQRTRASSIAPCAAARSICAQNLARIQNAFRIEGAFQFMHDAQFHRIRAAREFPGLEPPDAVLRADAAAETLDQIEHGVLENMRPAGEELEVSAGFLAQIEMQVAVAGMSVGNDVSLRSQFIRQCGAFFDEYRNR